MRDRREQICLICFGVLLAVGIGFLLMGLFVVPLMPHFQLDVVLSPSELADPQRRSQTLALFKAASGNQWLFWSLGGLVIILASGSGLWAALGLGCVKKSRIGAGDEV
jgi:hypothetical protein